MQTMTPKEIAVELGTDPKTCRRFLRKIANETPGKGGKWSIDAAMLPDLIARFETYRNRTTTTLNASNITDDDETAPDADD